ncbi:MAG TPA: tetratricopeptide repeat protein [Terriglobia bacterium]|nr:tetratricopeptide repeat protein [Terriglobia bacterium]
MKTIGLTLLAALLTFPFSASGQNPAPQKAASRKASREGDFKALVAQAEAAKAKDQVEMATGLYRQALEIKPDYVEGWWYLGMLYYESDQYADGADAFGHVTRMKPDVALGWAMLGLCQFEMEKYGRALVHLEHADQLGIPRTEDFYDVAMYHLAQLDTRSGDFDSAIRIAADFAHRGKDGPDVAEAMGIAALRKPLLPRELPPLEREMVMDVGRAMCDTAGRRASKIGPDISLLFSKYPKTPEIHFLAGTMELSGNTDQALADFKAELEINPDHARALSSIASEYVRRKDYKTALPFAEKAAAADPRSFVSHAVLGEVLTEGDIDLPRGIHELETAIQITPSQPQVHFVLAAAYAKAGRKEDAARERAEFLKLRSQGEVALSNPK